MKISCTLGFGFFALFIALANSALVSKQEFVKAVTSNGYGPPSDSQYKNFDAGLKNGQITDKMEAAMALAQFLHESGGLKKVREDGCSGDNGCAGRYPDDPVNWPASKDCSKSGQSYYGRGYLQLSYCQNYRLASQALGLGERLREKPDLVAQQEKLSWDVSFYFWGREVHPALNGNNKDAFGVTTNKINGPRECNGNGGAEGRQKAENRFKKYQKVYSAFNLPNQPNPRGCY